MTRLVKFIHFLLPVIVNMLFNHRLSRVVLFSMDFEEKTVLTGSKEPLYLKETCRHFLNIAAAHV